MRRLELSASKVRLLPGMSFNREPRYELEIATTLQLADTGTDVHIILLA